jgi:hypothetical protein
MKRLRTEEEAFQRMLEGDSATPKSEAEGLVKLVRALERGRPEQTGPAFDFQSVLRRKIVAEAERTVAMASWRIRAAYWLDEKNKVWRRSFRMVTATGLAASLLLGSGAMFASANSATPADGVRYAFDRAAEAVREAATRGSVPRGYLKMDLARERLDEIETMAADRVEVPEYYERALGDMDNNTLDATKLLVIAARDGAGLAPLRKLSAFTQIQRRRLENLLTDRALPAAVVPSARDSVEILTRVGDRVGDVIAGCPCPSNPLQIPTGAVDKSGEPSGVGCSCEQPTGSTGSTDGTGGSHQGNNGKKNEDPETPEPPQPPVVEEPNTLPDVDGTELDDEIEEIIEDLLENGVPGVPTTLPTSGLSSAPALPTLLPSALPTVHMPAL